MWNDQKNKYKYNVEEQYKRGVQNEEKMRSSCHKIMDSEKRDRKE